MKLMSSCTDHYHVQAPPSVPPASHMYVNASVHPSTARSLQLCEKVIECPVW